MNFETLTKADELFIARDVLRGKESDYFRLSLMDPSSYGGAPRLEILEGEIASIKKTLKALERAAAKEAKAAADAAEEA